MSVPVTMRIELPREYGPLRELRLGDTVTLGRPLPGAGPERVNVPGRWLGVPRDAMVSGELLRIAYQDLDRGRAMIGWRTGAQHHPASLRFGVTPPDAGTDVAAEGRLMVGCGEAHRLYVSRLSAQEQRFVQRFVLEFQVSSVAEEVDRQLRMIENTQPPWDHRWRSLVEDWWEPRRGQPAGVLTWRRCLQVTGRLLGAPEGRLADVVAEGLQHRGYRTADAEAVRKAWNRAVIELVDAVNRPDRRWMLAALAVPRLAEYVVRRELGENPGRLPSGEPQIRQLLASLRATGEPEWK